MLAGSLLGLLYAFLLLNSSSPVLSLGLYSCYFGLPWPISFPWAAPAHSNPSFPWAFAKSFGLPWPKLPHPLLSGLIGFSTNPYLLNSFLWVPSVHSCLLFISHNAHRFTTSFFGLLWACLLSLRPFCYFTDL